MTMMLKLLLGSAIVLTVVVVVAAGDPRNLASDGEGSGETPFLRSSEWGAGRFSYTKGPKGYKGSSEKHSKSPKSSKSPKGPKGSKGGQDCPTYDKKCTIGGNVSCPLHTTCQAACIPKFCKLPRHHKKVVSYQDDYEDEHFVKLGSICGKMTFVQGQVVDPRHLVEVCCEPKPGLLDTRNDMDDNDYGQCLACDDCDYPQKVNDSCCKIALGLDDKYARNSSYDPHCKEDEDCCKCGPGPEDYKCVKKHPLVGDDVCDLCTESTSTASSSGPTSTTTTTTTTTTRDPVCEMPEPPLSEEDYQDFQNVTECGDGTQTITANNTFIRLIDTITCDSFVGGNFLRIVGHNNTVDCGGYTVVDNMVFADAFQFSGIGNVLQNCPNITGFGEDAVQAEPGSSLFIRNVTANGNTFGLFLAGAEGYVMDSEFINSRFDGILARRSNAGDPFKLVLKGSAVTNNGIVGIVLVVFGEACLEDNIISQNEDNNVQIRQDSDGTPNVTLAENNFCDVLGTNVDIFDNTNVTTVLDNVQCETVSNGTVEINATEYGCVPCPDSSTTTVDSTSATTTSNPTSTTTTTSPRVCELPEPPLAEKDYEIFDNVTECGLGNQTITANNTFIRLQNEINCDFTGIDFFFRIIGDNNTVDCGGYTVGNTGNGIFDDGFRFNGVGNVLQNCPNITGFGQDAIQVEVGSSLFIRNITTDRNRVGLYLDSAEGYVVDSVFINRNAGIDARGSNADGPFKLILKGSTFTNNRQGAFLIGPGEVCLEENVISQNELVNVEIRQDREGGTPNVTLAENDFCDNLDNTDILDETNATTVLGNVQCEIVSNGTVGINATEYGCVPCTSP